MTFSAHALQRIKERFPELWGEQLWPEFYSAAPPTPRQLPRLDSALTSERGGVRLVSPNDVVFVVCEQCIVTVFKLPTTEEHEVWVAKQRRLHRPVDRYEVRRRRKERHWRKLLPEDDE